MTFFLRSEQEIDEMLDAFSEEEIAEMFDGLEKEEVAEIFKSNEKEMAEILREEINETCKNYDYKSDAEKQIAEILDKNGIKFHYEFPIAVIDKEKTKIWYPDFYLYEFGIIIEFFGLYNSNKNYKKNAQHKKNVYKKLGFELIPVYQIFSSLEKWLMDKIFWICQERQAKIEKIIIKNKK